MAVENVSETLKRELPALLRDDPDFRRYVLDLTRREYADRQQTEDRFNRILEELRQNREAQERKWAKQDRKWEEQDRKWWEAQEENKRKWEEQDRKWWEAQEENKRKWEEQDRKWEQTQEENKREREQVQEENRREWEEQKRKWEESRTEPRLLHEETMAQLRKYGRRISALGARWGMQSEASFRNALAGILEENFDIQVLNVNEYDEQGEVFGRPAQIELDIIIKNGLLLICELKSSMSKADVHLFERKARFYERRHGRKADRLIVISPMIDKWAGKLAKELGIDIYSDSSEVEEI